ncbi:hypothetical protein ACOMHN_013730 [Nucella lapillus]
MLCAVTLRGVWGHKTHVVSCCQSLLRRTAVSSAGSSSSVVSPSSAASKLSGDAKPFEDLPGPGGPPYFGTYFKYKLGAIDKSKLFDTVRQWHEQYGPVFKEVCLGQTIVHVADTEAIRIVYANDGKWPRIAPLALPVQQYRMKSGISLGLGNSNDEEWYQLRSAAQRLMMRPKEVVPFLPETDEVAMDFVSHLKNQRDADNEVSDFGTQLGRWGLESSGLHCFNKRLGYLTEGGQKEAEDILEAILYQFELMSQLLNTLPIYQYTSVVTPKWKKLFEVEDFIYGKTLKHLDEALGQLRERMGQGDLQDGEFRFLSYLLSRDELSKNDVAILAHALFTDPLSTVKPQLQFLLYYLATTPGAQDRLYEEIQSVAPPAPASLSPDSLRRMPYFRACFKESLRMMHMTNENVRLLQKDLVLGGYLLPEGTMVYLNHFALFRHPDHFSDPDVFLPERWLQDDTERKLDPIIVQPFSVGPRMCIGRRFAEQDMAVVVSRLLQQFRLEWTRPPMGMKYQLLNVPDCPTPFTLHNR